MKGGVWNSFYDSSLDAVLRSYNEWFVSGLDDLTIAIYEDWELEEQFEEWLDKNEILFDYRVSVHPMNNVRSSIYTITKEQFKEKEMSTIEQLKQTAMKQLEALQVVGSNLDTLKTKLSGVTFEDLVTAYIQSEVTKIDNYAKRNKIDFKVDTSELVKLIKLPDAHAAKKPSQILPFLPREGATVEDQSWCEWKLVDGEWTDTWHNSWQSSSDNC